MACFTLAYLFQLAVWLIVVAALIAIVRLLLPRVIKMIGGEGVDPTIVAIVQVLIWAGTVIVVLYVVWDVLGCLTGLGRYPGPR